MLLEAHNTDAFSYGSEVEVLRRVSRAKIKVSGGLCSFWRLQGESISVSSFWKPHALLFVTLSSIFRASNSGWVLSRPPLLLALITFLRTPVMTLWASPVA